MSRRILYNASIINEGTTQTGYVIIEGDKIAAVGQGAPDEGVMASCDIADDLAGAMLLPGVIDGALSRAGSHSQSRHSKRKPRCCGRWRDFVYGYAEYHTSNH